ncbi:MAG: [LysW]-lysine hydrolase [Anaerolineales bacterium]|jgi:LysW-gamma-L-lysine carboxypeptidase
MSSSESNRSPIEGNKLQPPETLVGLLERYSPTGQEAEAAAWLVQRMLSLGFTRAFLDPAGNAVGVLGDGPREIVLLGHIDTVSGRIPVHLEDGKLYGRGSVDAKGALAAFVDAASAVGACQGWRIVVIGAVEEEGDSRGARFAAGQYHPEYAVIGEPSFWDRITVGYKGFARARITVRRPPAHSASGLPTASEEAVALWASLSTWTAEFNKGRERAFDQLQVALRAVSSGEDDSTEWGSLQVWARLPLDFPPSSWYESVQTLFTGRPVEFDSEGFAIPAFRGGKDNRLVSEFLRAIRAEGGEPRFVVKSGTADLNFVAPAWGCPALAYGPGDSSLDHTLGENLPLSEYDRAVRVVSNVIDRLVKAT